MGFGGGGGGSGYDSVGWFLDSWRGKVRVFFGGYEVVADVRF